MNKLERGTQVIYIPNHCENKYQYGCEPGFITSGPDNNGDYFVRFWQVVKHEDFHTGEDSWRIAHPIQLRTKANSERCAIENLLIVDSVGYWTVESAITEYC